jgi:hypothetical protein
VSRNSPRLPLAEALVINSPGAVEIDAMFDGTEFFEPELRVIVQNFRR